MKLVRLSVNGETREFSGPLSVADLLQQLKAPRDAVAVEVDRQVIPRLQREACMLQGGEQVEVVTLVGGG
jgi:thiamine biosynthesis protein ThiS